LFYTIQSIYLIYIVIDSDCGEPLLEKAVLKATSSLPDRGPENAILNGNYKYVFFFLFRLNTFRFITIHLWIHECCYSLCCLHTMILSDL